MKKEYNTLKEIQKRLKQINKQLEKLDHERYILEDKLEKVCDYSLTEKISDYYPGSYYDLCYWENYEKCKICGKQLSEKKIIKGGYG